MDFSLVLEVFEPTGNGGTMRGLSCDQFFLNTVAGKFQSAFHKFSFLSN